MAEITERLIKAKTKYKKNYDARLRKKSEVIHVEEYVYLRVERNNSKEHYHNLAPISESPYKVTKGDQNKYVIEKTEQSVEKSITLCSHTRSKTT